MSRVPALRPRVWATAAALAAAGAAPLATAPAAAAELPAVPPNTRLAGVALDGRSPEQVRALLERAGRRLAATPVRILYAKRVEATTAGALGAELPVEEAFSLIVTLAPDRRNFVERLFHPHPPAPLRDLVPPVRVDAAVLAKRLRRFAARIGLEARDARVTREKGAWKRTPPEPGRELDAAALAGRLQGILASREFIGPVLVSLDQEPSDESWQAAMEPLSIPAATRPAAARITLAHARMITGTLVSFRTSLAGSSRNRVHNVDLACRAIDGTVLLPGDTFSYNDVVGPRVPSAGYREAPVIIRGELQPGTGGGICQVSSTLYNAVLLGNLGIVRRRPHAFPVHYLPAGRDATVVDGSVDFQFRNTLAHPIAIDAKVVGRQVVIQIYGNPADRVEVELLAGGVKRVPAGSREVKDPNLAAGKRVVEKPARDGRRVTITRVVKIQGREIRREVVSRDYYPPFSGLVRVGTMAPPPVTPPGTAPASTQAGGAPPAGGTPVPDAAPPPAASSGG